MLLHPTERQTDGRGDHVPARRKGRAENHLPHHRPQDRSGRRAHRPQNARQSAFRRAAYALRGAGTLCRMDRTLPRLRARKLQGTGGNRAPERHRRRPQGRPASTVHAAGLRIVRQRADRRPAPHTRVRHGHQRGPRRYGHRALRRAFPQRAGHRRRTDGTDRRRCLIRAFPQDRLLPETGRADPRATPHCDRRPAYRMLRVVHPHGELFLPLQPRCTVHH